MGNVYVPMAGKNAKIHMGHRELIEHAKSLGDVTIVLMPKFRSQVAHLLNNITIEYDEDLTEQINSIKELGVKVEVKEFLTIDSETRTRLLSKAQALVELYKDELLLERFYSKAVYTVMSTLVKSEIGKTREIDTTVFGPEVINFFFKSVGKLLGKSGYFIFSKVVKHTKTKVRYQGAYDLVPSEIRNSVLELRDVIDSAKSHYKVGPNVGLVNELNISYKNKVWDVCDIGVFEGGIVDGRLETISFRFPLPDKSGTKGSSILIEEIDYYA